jgi:uncharacterized protein
VKRTIVALALLTVGLALGAASCATRGASGSAVAAKKINALIITGADPAHAWKENAETIKGFLDRSGRFDTELVEGCNILTSAAELSKFDVLLLLGAFQERRGGAITNEAKRNLLDFVNNGKGFYAQHLASSSWESWDDFAKMCGRRWVIGTSGHGQRTPFEVKLTDSTHPITRGLENFTIDDECYAKFGIFRDVRVLATGYSSNFSQVDEPMLMASQFGKGRVVINNLGHDRKALENPGTVALILRGVEWAATGRVAAAAR